MKKDSVLSPLLVTCLCSIPSSKRGEEQGSKSPFSLLSEPISPSSLNFYRSLLTFISHFIPSPNFFPLFLPPPNFFWAISPSSLFCSSPLSSVVHGLPCSLKYFSTPPQFTLKVIATPETDCYDTITYIHTLLHSSPLGTLLSYMNIKIWKY